MRTVCQSERCALSCSWGTRVTTSVWVVSQAIENHTFAARRNLQSYAEGPSAKRRQGWLVGAMRVATEMTGAAKPRAEFSCPPSLVEVGRAVGLMLAWVFTTRRQNMLPQIYARPTCGCRFDASHRAAGNERVLSSSGVVRALALRCCSTTHHCTAAVALASGFQPGEVVHHVPFHFGRRQHRPRTWIRC